jgi:hypothetical protein
VFGERLEESRGENQERPTSTKSGWDKYIIEEQRDSWNDDVMMDTNTGGKFLGGTEHGLSL